MNKDYNGENNTSELYQEYLKLKKPNESYISWLERQLQDSRGTNINEMTQGSSSQNIEELNLSVRTWHCLKRYGVQTIEDLSSMTDDELAKIRYLGFAGICEIKERLKTR
jgi:DNA-directed RNA polymerase alpha subunit